MKISVKKMSEGPGQKTDVGSAVTLSPDNCITFVAGKPKTEFVVNNNSTTKNVCFKIRTTMPLLFVVKPNQGIIEAKG